MFSSGVLTIAGMIIFPDKLNFLSPFVLWGYGIVVVKIYVGNLSFETTENELRDLFAEFGEVGDVNLITDRETGRPRGFGFVELPDDSAAREAISALDGKEVSSRQLKVNEAKPRTDRGGGGGGGGRRW